MASFDENGKYIKTNWKAGDKITATKLNKIEESIEAVNDNDISRHVEADARLDALEAKNTAQDKELTNVKNLIEDAKAAAELGDYEINSRMTFLEQELNEGIEEVHNVAETVDGKIATAEANMTAQVNTAKDEMAAQVNQGKADMEAMVAEVEADLEGLHAKDEELSEQLADIENNKADKVFSSVKDFGAIGDGVTDDTEAIQECLNNANIIKFESKVYRITRNIIVEANKIIDLNGSTIIYDSTTWHSIFNIQGSNVKIINGTLINENGANCYMGIGVNISGTNDDRLYNMTFENLTMRNMVIWTPNPVNGLGTGIYANFTNNMIIRNVKVYDVQGFGIHFGRCNDCVVDSCYVENVYGHAYSFSGEDYVCENCKLINSTGRNTGYAGIDLEGGKNCTVCNNTFENIGCYDDTITENNLQSAIVYATLGTNNAIVSGNIINNVKWGGILVPTIANEDLHKVVIKGNVIENAIKFGINVGYNGNRTNANCWWIISDNVICNSEIGINGGYILHNAIISSNFIDTCSEGIKGYFISSNITDNRIHDFTTNGIFLNWFDNGNINNNTLVSDSSIASTVHGINIDRSTGHIYNTCVLNNNIKLRNSNDFGVRLYAYGGVTDLVINNNLVNSDNLIRSYYMAIQGEITRVYVSDGKGKIRDMSTGTWS